MITAFVTVPLPPGLTRGEWHINTQVLAQRFQGVPGLIRKNFIFNRDTGLGGGVYTWESREIAEKFYAPGGAWHTSLTERFGAEPVIQWFDSPIIVDNKAGGIDVTA
jgi:Putative mono-oxygenase ydhR